MKQRILKIDASLRKDGAHSRALSERLIEHLNKQIRSTVKERHLSDGIAAISEAWVIANSTDIKQRTAEQRSILSCSDALINELQNSNVIVIGLPIYSFNIPSLFKAWIDQIVRANVTFKYTKNGPKGLLKKTKVYIIVTSGGTRLGSKIDFVSGYLHHIFNFIGMGDVTLIDCTGIGQDEQEKITSAQAQIDSI